MGRSRLVPLLALCLAGEPARAELYRWTDAKGQMHVTMHLDEVPPDQRPSAAQSARDAAKEPSRVQSYAQPGPAAGAPAARALQRAPAAAPKPVYQVRVERAGTSMIVQVRLNDRVTAPFVIDTGASDVLIPKSVADELGIQPGPEARTMRYQTANGVIDSPVVTLESVEVGGARVEGVPASIGSGMGVGLLGLSFFNHFTYRVDAAAGLVTLSPNGLEESGLIRGGRSAAEWRSQFQNLRMRIEQVEGQRASTPPAHMRELTRLADAKQDLERQLEQLESEADTAHVPMSWRD
ncbi:MAG TPA: TIGR02281 family clan AA aspartic protease [Myxococcota bacterium]|jgi:clan AA aspartic protease (TIGR02281 family)|nr:TIGR02281 family clan AA aspartic protease [Myxococcota bacterium]